jgi:hypothetical protein
MEGEVGAVMAFLAPAWLFALIPWGALALWSMFGRRKRTWVPYLPLWDAPEELKRPKKGFEPPPIALVLALLATLLGLVAMARPMWDARRDRGGVTIIVDRGDSMSARINGRARYADLASEVAPKVAETLGPGKVDLIDAVGSSVEATDRSNWQSLVANWKRTALDSTESLRSTVRQRLERGESVLLLSDRDLAIEDDQLIQVKPRRGVHNAGIVALAHRPGRVMVTLRTTDANARTLRIQCRDQTAVRTIDLEPGADQKMFVDLNAPADTIEASLEGADDFDGDDRAWLVPVRAWPVVQTRTPVPDELRRMIDVYSKLRLPAEGSSVIAIARPGELKSDEAGVALAQVDTGESPQGQVSARAHPILTGVDFSPLQKSAAVATRPPGEGWTWVARIGAHTIIAVREGEVRQVWVGFESREFARTPAFVVFWTNLLDWIGNAGEGGFAASWVDQQLPSAKRLAPQKLPDDVDAAFWPGVFETPAGKLAANVRPITFGGGGGGDGTNWQARLSGLKLRGGSGINLAHWLALAALACLLIAVATWEKPRIALNRAIA